jgi:hypothetical protein
VFGAVQLTPGERCSCASMVLIHCLAHSELLQIEFDYRGQKGSHVRYIFYFQKVFWLPL